MNEIDKLIKHLMYKYYGKLDEDLKQECYLIYHSTLKEFEGQNVNLQNYFYTRIKNKIIDTSKKMKQPLIEETSYQYKSKSDNDYSLVEMEIRNCLKGRDYVIFDYIMQGKKDEEIMELLEIEKSTLYNTKMKIKNLILEK